MADLEKTIETLSSLPLNNLAEDWVKCVWDSDFTDYDSTETGIGEDEAVIPVLNNFHAVLDGWRSVEQDGEGLWTVLVENDISLKAVIAYLGYLVHVGGKRLATLNQKETAIMAASVHFKLITVPGSGAFKIFHPEPYEKAVDLLKLFNTTMSAKGPTKRKRSTSPVASQKSQRQRAGKSRRRNKDTELSFEEEMMEGSQMSDEEEAEDLSYQDMDKLRKQLMRLLRDLILLLKNFSLRQSESSAYHTVQLLTQLTRHDVDLFDGEINDSIPLQRLPLPALAYKGLLLLCQQLHGHVGTMTNAVCKYLLPNLLMLVGENKSAQTISRHMQLVRDHAINFIGHIIKECGDRGSASVRTLLQHMCVKVPDRAEYRLKVSQAVITILQQLPAESYGRMVEWFYKLSKHTKINNRGFAIDIVAALLAIPERQAGEGVSPALIPYIKHRSLLGILLARCSDIAPTVRARAIGCFSQCFTSSDAGIQGTMREIVTPKVGPKKPHPPRLVHTPGVEINIDGSEDESSKEGKRQSANSTIPTESHNTSEASTIATENSNLANKEGQTPLQGVILTPGYPNLEDEEGVLSMFRRRAGDERVNVRKAALQAIESAIHFEAPDYRKEDVEILKGRCRDPALSVRKQSMQSLTDILFKLNKDKFIQSAWLDGVLPLVIDRETTLQEKCYETLEDVILRNIVQYNRSNGESHQLAWAILGILAQPESVDQRRYMQKACHHWSRQGGIKPGLISALESHINTENNEGAWMLLAEIAPAAPKINPSFLLRYWEQHSTIDCSSMIMEKVLTVMKCVAKHLPRQDRENLIIDLKCRLKKFDSPPELIAVSVNTLSKLCEVQAEETGDLSIKQNWCTDLLQACDNYLSSVVLEEEAGEVNEDLIVRHLFTLGEVVQLCPAKTPKRIFLLVQSLIAAPCISADSSTRTSSDSQPSQDSQKPQEARQSESSGNVSTGSSDDSVESAVPSHDSQGSQGSQPTQVLSQFKGQSKMSNRIRAFAFIALGKLCLQNESLAKKCVAALARELETSTDPSIRNNVVIVMCDLCVRYTTTADCYVSNIASCLKDPSPLVRKQTLTLITRLLQEDFLKWKGVLFFRFITTLLDENKDIGEFAEFCLVHLLMQRHPKMFSQHFMECIFHFNCYDEHTVFNKFPQTERDKQMFSLEGKSSKSKRLKLYLFMLENMLDEQKFSLTAKLCQEILGGVVDGVLPLDDKSCPILQDALAILASKEIKLSSLKTKPQEDIISDEQEMAAAVIATAKKTLITQVVKKNVIENIVPIVVSLKHMLERHRSPVLRDLMFYLRELMKDYKNEVKEVLTADRQLATEIEFDLKKFEEQQQEQQAPVTPAGGPQVPPSPGSKPTSPAPRVENATPTGGISPSSPGAKATSPRVAGTSPRATGTPPRGPGTPPKVQGTPEREGTVGTAKPAAPIMKLMSPSRGAMASPARNQSLSTMAILNSARKAVEKAQQVRKERDSPKVQRRKSGSTRGTPRRTSDENMPSSEETGRVLSRAISTPSGALGNITFMIDNNITMMPPSPISVSSQTNAFKDDADTPVTPKRDKGKKTVEDEKQVIYMMSPDAPRQKPRQWNIISKAPPRSTKSSISSVDELDEDSEISLAGSDSEGGVSDVSVQSKQSTRLRQSNVTPKDRPVAKASRRSTRKKTS